jgi:hypothetical protein
MQYAMKLAEDVDGQLRTVIVVARKHFVFRDDHAIAEDVIQHCGGEVWSLDEWQQDHWFVPRKWGRCEEVPPLKASRRNDGGERMTDCG